MWQYWSSIFFPLYEQLIVNMRKVAHPKYPKVVILEGHVKLCWGCDHVYYCLIITWEYWSSDLFPHYEQLLFNRCCCVREKGRTFSPHPHVTILIKYLFPALWAINSQHEKGRTPKVSKGCYLRGTCPIMLGMWSRLFLPHYHVRRVAHFPHTTMWLLITLSFPHCGQLIFNRCCSVKDYLLTRSVSPIIGTHTRPTPVINFIYRHKNHIPKTQSVGSLIRAYIAGTLTWDEIRTV